MAIIALALSLGCRRKPPPPPAPPVTVEEAPPPAPAEEAQPAPPVAEEPPPLPPPAAFGHAPSDDELRAKLQPLLPAIEKCVQRQNPEGPVVLRFGVSPATGTAIAVLLAGKPDDCSESALRELHVEPWSGTPNIVQLPLTRDGRPMHDTDGGLQ
jgi:type IV secretory pathway VirB10-like protein